MYDNRLITIEPLISIMKEQDLFKYKRSLKDKGWSKTTNNKNNNN
jgi:hypothetical protein